MNIDDRPLNELDNKTIGILKHMTIQGMMWQRLWAIQGNERAIILEEDGVRKAWAMIFPSRHNKQKFISYFYTRPRFRRKGYGAIIGSYLDIHYENVYVCPWDSVSHKFFDALPFFASKAWS